MPKHRRAVPVIEHGHRKVQLTVPMALSDAVSQALWDAGVLGVTIDDDETRARPHDATIPRTGLATVEGTFAKAWGLESRVLLHVRGALTAADAHGEMADLRWEDVPDQDWQQVWKKHWKPLRVGQDAWVVPSWEKATFKAPRSSIPLYVDPGMAFGTGTHETTQLCCSQIEVAFQQRSDIRSVLDVGTGSGILAILAGKLAKRARREVKLVGIDVDTESVRVALENAKRNRVTLTADDTPVGQLKGTYDLVVANILLDPLVGMMTVLARLTAQDGTLIMSGILETQRAALERAATSAGLRVVSHQIVGNWAAVVCAHRNGAT